MKKTLIIFSSIVSLALLISLSLALVIYLKFEDSTEKPTFYDGSIACSALMQREKVFPLPKLWPIPVTQVSSDIDILIALLEDGYSGKKFLPKGEYVNLLQSIRNLKQEAITVPTILSIKISNIFNKVSDGHLHATSIKDFGLGAIFVALNARRDISWDDEIIANKKVLRLSIPHFAQTTSAWEDFIARLEDEKDDYDAIIIDVRNHNGGYGAYADELAAELYGVGLNGANFSQYFPMALESSFSLNTPTTVVGAYNTLFRSFSNSSETASNKAYYEGLNNKKCLQNLDNKIIKDETNIVNEPFNEEDAFKGSIFFITGRSCVSACEVFVSHMQGHKNALIIGGPTNGTLHFGGPATHTLPNSRVTVTIPYNFIKFKNGEFYEKKGIPPQKTILTSSEINDFIRGHLSN